jgi:hypothetical protein
MASPDLNDVFNDALNFAVRMLRAERCFIPFGVLMTPDGELVHVGTDTGSESPSSTEVIDLLQAELRERARSGTVRAAGICLDVLVVPPNEVEKVDSVCVWLAHVSGEAMSVYMPYSIDGTGEVRLGRTFSASKSKLTLVST